MKSKEILERYINFYKQREHVEIPNISLIPENEPSLLFVNSGMFPLVTYLTGKATHPEGKRVVNVQRCLRFEDLENVGETLRHTTAFHMIGNWSFGDYFKKEQLPWIYEFLVEELQLEPNRLFSTVFEGDTSAPRDDESIAILKAIFAKYGIDAKVGERIFTYDKKENWWQRGDAIGELGGPDSEIYYYLGEKPIPLGVSPADNDDLFLEIGNSVFLQYEFTAEGWKEIKQKNVDFGGGLERLALVQQKKKDIYETDNFWPIIEEIQRLSAKEYNDSEETKKHMRKVADHMRSACLMVMDGVTPSNKEQGYILRRFIRLMIRSGFKLGIEKDLSVNLVGTVGKCLSWIYPVLVEKQAEIETLFAQEETKFRKTLNAGMHNINRNIPKIMAEKDAKLREELATTCIFNAYQSLGYPVEMSIQDFQDNGIHVDVKTVLNKVKEHQELSREGAKEKFTGGLADQEVQTIQYHTATHLLHWALRKVLGDHVQQMGSNITGKRLRFDFTHSDKLTDQEIKKITELINEQTSAGLDVNYVTLPIEEAEKTGALHFFGEKYGEKVNVYYIGASLETSISKEFCGGPHVKNTKEIGKIEIFKQKKIGENLVRVYARKVN